MLYIWHVRMVTEAYNDRCWQYEFKIALTYHTQWSRQLHTFGACSYYSCEVCTIISYNKVGRNETRLAGHGKRGRGGGGKLAGLVGGDGEHHGEEE